MIVEYIRYTIPDDRAEQFVRAYEQAAEPLLASPHCLGYDVARCVDEPDSFIVRIHWDSAAGHLDGFRKGPHFPPFLDLVKPFFNNISEMRHYNLVTERSRD